MPENDCTNCVCFWWSDCAFALPSRAERYRFTTRLVWVGRPHCRFGSTHGRTPDRAAAGRGVGRGVLCAVCACGGLRDLRRSHGSSLSSACEGVLCLVCCCTHTDAQKRIVWAFFSPSLRASGSVRVILYLYCSWDLCVSRAGPSPHVRISTDRHAGTSGLAWWRRCHLTHSIYICMQTEGAEH